MISVKKKRLRLSTYSYDDDYLKQRYQGREIQPRFSKYYEIRMIQRFYSMEYSRTLLALPATSDQNKVDLLIQQVTPWNIFRYSMRIKLDLPVTIIFIISEMTYSTLNAKIRRFLTIMAPKLAWKILVVHRRQKFVQVS